MSARRSGCWLWRVRPALTKMLDGGMCGNSPFSRNSKDNKTQYSSNHSANQKYRFNERACENDFLVVTRFTGRYKKGVGPGFRSWWDHRTMSYPTPFRAVRLTAAKAGPRSIQEPADTLAKTLPAANGHWLDRGVATRRSLG